MPVKYIPFEEVLEEDLKDPEEKAEWDRHNLAREVSTWVLKYRIAHKLSETALGKQVGLTQQAISRLEMGDVIPSLETLNRLCKAFGQSMTLKLTGENRMEITFE